MAQHGRFKAFSPSSTDSSFPPPAKFFHSFLNKVLICLETLQSFPAAVPVGLREHRVGSLPSLMGLGGQSGTPPSLSLSVVTMVQKERGRARCWAEDLEWPDTTCHRGPLSLQTTQNRIEGTCIGKEKALLERDDFTNPGQQQPSAGPCIGGHFTSNTSSYKKYFLLSPFPFFFYQWAFTSL